MHARMQVVAMAKDSNYLFRMSVLYCLRDLCPALSPADTAAVVIPACLAAAADRVPNTRFVAARVLQALAPIVQQTPATGQVVACLKHMLLDADADVKFFAQRSLATYETPEAALAS
jgi:serine/threonine-protein phosphatase 2A regulatory subunit A